MLDCDEQLALDKLLRRGKETGNPEDSLSSIAARLNYFKSNTLACAKHIDDQGKLIVVSEFLLTSQPQPHLVWLGEIVSLPGAQ